MSDCLNMIVADMSECLSASQLKLILLNAIPERQVRDIHPTAPKRRPGLPYCAPSGPPIQAEVYDEAYSAQFPDTDALEYLELICGVVQSLNPNPETLTFLLDGFDEYFSKQAPVFFQPILIIFKKWSELSAGNPPTALDPSGVAQRSSLHLLTQTTKIETMLSALDTLGRM